MRVLKILGFVVIGFFLIDKGFGLLADRKQDRMLLGVQESYGLVEDALAGRELGSDLDSRIAVDLKRLLLRSKRLNQEFEAKFIAMQKTLDQPGWATNKKRLSSAIALCDNFADEGIALCAKTKGLYEDFIDEVAKEAGISRTEAMNHPRVSKALDLLARERAIFDREVRAFAKAYRNVLQFVKDNGGTAVIQDNVPNWNDRRLQGQWLKLLNRMNTTVEKLSDAETALEQERQAHVSESLSGARSKLDK